MMQQSRQELEGQPLDQLLMHWTSMLWSVGMGPLLERLNKLDLSFPEMVVLRNLQRGPLKVAEVAHCISITQSAASRAVDRLVHDGFVDRHENPDDRRQKQLTLTQPGEGLLEDLESIMTSAIGPILSALTVQEQNQLRALIAKMFASQHSYCPMAHDARDSALTISHV
jgi:DNA-binding MarR family transcriptional regulator